MNNQEAEEILQEYLKRYRKCAYDELASMIGNVETFQATGDSGTNYQVEVQFFWDDTSRKNIRVMGGIDDGGLRAFVPLCRSFIIAPDGKFIGE